MLTDAFYWVLNMSLTATAVGLAALLLRRVRRLPRAAVLGLWGVVALRLVLPFSFASPYSPMGLATALTSRSVDWESGPANAVAVNHLRAAQSYFPIVYKSLLLERVFAVGAVLWAVGVLASWVWLALSAVAASRLRRGAVKADDGTYRSGRIDTPMVVGVLRPRILVPAGIDPETLRWALLHERVHLRRGDNLLRAVAAAVAGLHWFNPMAWVFLRAFRQDLEDACDARVLKGRTAEERTDYARALFAYARRETAPPAPAFGGGDVRRRIGLVLSFRTLTVGALAAFAALWAAIAFVLLANPG